MVPGSVAYASLSVQTFINKVGNDAGFAAIIAVALLIVMLFVHARETAALRDRAEEAEERLHRLEYHAEQTSRSLAALQAAQAAAAGQAVRTVPPASAATGAAPAMRLVGSAGGRGAAASAPPGPLLTVPALMAAPALGSASRLIPLPLPAAPATNGGPTPAPATPGPATVAAAGPVAAAPTAAVVTPPPFPTTSPPPARVIPQPATGSAGPGRAPRRNYGRAESPPPRRKVGLRGAVAAIALVAVIVVALVLVLGHHGSPGSATRAADRTTSTASSRHHGSGKKQGAKSSTTKTVSVDPTKVTVYVLNGTSTNDLAADISAKLNHVGFQQGGTGNFTDATQTSTVVGYEPGDSVQAYAVASALGLSRHVVQPVSTAAREIACAAYATDCPDQVIVTVGADLDSDA